MARATFVKKARKDIPSAGIKAGESYYWWKFRFGGKYFSKTAPRRSQLTQSEFYSQVYEIEDEIAGATADESLKDFVEDIASRLREIGEDCQSKRDNMPESLQDSDTGSLLEERAQAMETAADEFESIDFDDAPDEDPDENPDEETADEGDHGDAEIVVTAHQDKVDEYWQGKLEEVQAISIDAP